MAEIKPQPTNVAAERAVLSGLCQHGQSAYSDIIEFINLECFSKSVNQNVFMCIQEIFKHSESVDYPTIVVKAKELGLTSIEDKVNQEYIVSLFNFKTSKDTIKQNAASIRKLSLVRKAQNTIKEMYVKLGDMTGNETVSEILTSIEEPIYSFSNSIASSNDDKTILLCNNILEYIEHVTQNKVENIGIPSPWYRYNKAIGGGRRRGGVYLIGARPKCLNVNTNVVTPTGLRKITDIKIGDIICHPSGGTTKVIDIIPTHQTEEYVVELDKHDYVSCSDNHEWLVQLNGSDVLLTTLQIFDYIKQGMLLSIKRPTSSPYTYDNVITNVVKTGRKIYATCVTVDAPDNLFILEGYIVTHNCGKAQPFTSKIVTRDGYKLMGDIKIGDMICGYNNTLNRVIGIHFWGILDCYKITFSDGSYTHCNDKHEWTIFHHTKKELITKELRDFKDNLNEGKIFKWCIPITATEFNEQEVPLDPYLVGVLIGDGSLTSNSVVFTNADIDIIEKVRTLIPEQHVLKPSGKFGYRITCGRTGGYTPKIKQDMLDLELLGCNSYTKFIPNIYKYNTLENRYKLLSGLVDTDGYVSKTGMLSISTVSEQLRDDIIEVVQSIGGIAVAHVKHTKSQYGKPCTSYVVRISLDNYDNLDIIARKKERLNNRTKGPLFRRITNVEYVGQERMQCISVDNDNGLYITDNFILTHNSTLAINDAVHCAYKLNVPTLYLDTEMREEGQWPRILAKLAKIGINDIEKGNLRSAEVDKLIQIGKEIKNIPLYYRKIAGKPFPEIMSIIRNFIVQHVGTSNGVTNDCMIIYDYFKLMDVSSLKDMQEYQAMGFQIQELTNMCLKYDVPCSAYVQLNRDGITKDTSDAISQSDRLVWLCSSLAMLKRKSSEEIALDGPEYGNSKLIVCAEQRFGPGLDDDNYINLMIQRDKCIVDEVCLKSEVKQKQAGFEENDDTDKDDVF